MDILKELFGTSDELQISKSLFGGEASASSEELGLDHPPVSPSRDYLSSRPLPLLPVEPRPQTVATSSLIRSQSLDDLHAPSSNDVDNIFRPDVLRAQSVFPQLSETGTGNHVNLQNVPHEMPMYLLEEDEGNDEEIRRLLETTADSTPNHSGTSTGNCGTPSGSTSSCSGPDIDRVALEMVAMETEESLRAHIAVETETESLQLSSTVCHEASMSVGMAEMTTDCNSWPSENQSPSSVSSEVHTSPPCVSATPPVSTTTTEITTATSKQSMVAVSSSSGHAPQLVRSIADRPSSIFPSRHTPSVATATTVTNTLGSRGNRRHSLSPTPSVVVGRKPPLPPSLPLSPPLITLPPSQAPPTATLLQAPPTATPPLTSTQQSIERLRAQVLLQSKKLEQVLKSLLPSSSSLKTTVAKQRHVPPLIGPSSVGVTTATSTTATSSPPLVTTPSYLSLRNTGLWNGTETASSWPHVKTADLERNVAQISSGFPSLRNTGLKTAPHSGGERVNSQHSGGERVNRSCEEMTTDDGGRIERVNDETDGSERVNVVPSNGVGDEALISTCSRAVQAGNTPHTVSMETKQTTPTIVSMATKQTTPTTVAYGTERPTADIDMKKEGVATSPSKGKSPRCRSFHGNKQDDIATDTVEESVSAHSVESADPSSNSPTVTITSSDAPSLKITTPFHSTFSVCVPGMNWRVQPFGSVLGLKALPITILPPSPEAHPSHLTTAQGDREAPVASGNVTTPTAPATKRRRNGGGWPKGKRRKIVENDLPKPPSTAYSLYLSETRKEVKFKSLSMSQLSKTIGRMWSQLPAEAKQGYRDRAVKDRERYMNDLKSHLTKKQKEYSSCDLESVNDILNRLVSAAEDNSLLLCQLCKLTFSTLHNKHCHLTSRTHTHTLLQEMRRVMGLQEVDRNGDRDGRRSVPVGMECGHSGMECDRSVAGMEGGISVPDGMECGTGNGMESCETGGMESGNEIGESGMEPKVMESGPGSMEEETSTTKDMDRLDVQSDGRHSIPSGMESGCSVTARMECGTENGMESCEDGISQSTNGPEIDEGNSPVSSPRSVWNGDTPPVEWAQDYTAMLTALKQQARDLKPPSDIETGKTGFLNQFQERERDLLEQVDSLISLLHTVTPSHPHTLTSPHH